MRSAARPLALVATVALAVLLLVPLPSPADGFGPPESDKAMHVLLFGLLTALWLWDLRLTAVRQVALVAGAVAAYGGALELLQALTPYRSCDWRDFAADGVGALAAATAWWVLRRLSPRRLEGQR